MKDKLNQLLADLVTEYHKLQTYHWYVKGKDFFPAHAKLEEYYDALRDQIDEVAEHLLMIGGEPIASQKEFLGLTKVEEAKKGFVASEVVFAEVMKDFQYLIGVVKEIKEEADKEGCYIISPLMDNYLAYYAKALWMLRQMQM